ncbi:rsc6 baf60a-like with a swib related protein [Cystoisospora suis]|uniref:Rsc6 baf60a-like with a swib related protein n=1 Tax=Cystoisospora suis TaxID=483139 RepID=A0A2C6KTF7_9APIC|nr:rsc6 baf60a-like with a swib related protein [Cystoisospora suis]
MTSSAVLSPGLNGGVAGLGSPSTRPSNQDTGKLNNRNTLHGLTPRKPTTTSSEAASSASPAPLSSTSKKATGGGSAVSGGGGGPRQSGSSAGGHGSKPDLVSRLTDTDGPVFVPECVREFCPDLYGDFVAMTELQREMDEATEHLLTSLRDTCYPCLHTTSRATLPTLLSRRRLRVFIYNTHENQPPAYSAFDQHAPVPDHAAAEAAAAALAAAQNSAATGGGSGSSAAGGGAGGPVNGIQGSGGQSQQSLKGIESSEVHVPPPSWCLHIKGVCTDKHDGGGGGGGAAAGGGLCPPRFSSFFSRVMVLTDEETILWDSRTTSSLGASTFDGLSIQRKGSAEMTLKILFFVNYRTPTFRLSAPLAALCGGHEQLSLCGILRGIWAHVLSKQLLLLPPESQATLAGKADEGASSTAASSGSKKRDEPAKSVVAPTVDASGILHARTDTALQAVFGSNVNLFRLSDLPRLLRGHLMPPRPVCISHPLKLSGDWIDNEQTYEFTLECIDTAGSGLGNTASASLAGGGGAGGASAACSSSSSSSPAAEALLQSMASSCCSLGLDAWLSASQQVLLQQVGTSHLSAAGGAGGGGSKEETEEQDIIHEMLNLQQQTEELDLKMKQTVEKLQQRVMYRNMYTGFANDPVEFVNQHLSRTLPEISDALLDSDFLYDYEAKQRTASYFSLPWVPRAIHRYLQKQRVPYEDQVCKVLSAFNIPDPRKRHGEVQDAGPSTTTQVANAGASSAPAGTASSRSTKPRTATGTGGGGASAAQRSRTSAGNRHAKKKEEAPTSAPPSSSWTAPGPHGNIPSSAEESRQATGSPEVSPAPQSSVASNLGPPCPVPLITNPASPPTVTQMNPVGLVSPHVVAQPSGYPHTIGIMGGPGAQQPLMPGGYHFAPPPGAGGMTAPGGIVMPMHAHPGGMMQAHAMGAPWGMPQQTAPMHTGSQQYWGAPPPSPGGVPDAGMMQTPMRG